MATQFRSTRATIILRSEVPCNGCRACCINDHVSLHPELGDKAMDHAGMLDYDAQGVAWLKHKDNGECIYLAERGCSLFGQSKRPALCIELDCRRLLKLPKEMQRHIGAAVLEAARKLPHLPLPMTKGSA